MVLLLSSVGLSAGFRFGRSDQPVKRAQLRRELVREPRASVHGLERPVPAHGQRALDRLEGRPLVGLVLDYLRHGHLALAEHPHDLARHSPDTRAILRVLAHLEDAGAPARVVLVGTCEGEHLGYRAFDDDALRYSQPSAGSPRVREDRPRVHYPLHFRTQDALLSSCTLWEGVSRVGE